MIAGRSTRWLSIALTVILGIAIVYPTVAIFREAFIIDGQLSFDNVAGALADPALAAAARDTLILGLAGALIATVFGTLLAVATVVIPARRSERWFLMLAPLAPLTIPPLVGAIGWLFLLAPRAGWINVFLRWLTGDESGEGPWNAYSMPVVIWVMGLYVVPYVYTIMASSLSRLSAEVIEAYQVNGASLTGAMLRAIVGPLRPAFLAAISLAVVQALSQLAIPMILQWEVLTTLLERQTSLLGQTGRAAVVGLPLLSVALAFTFVQLQLTRRGNRYTTVSGRGAGVRDLSFGKGIDRGLKGFTYIYFALAGALPIAAIGMVSLLGYWRPNFTWDDITLNNYVGMFSNTLVRDSALNSFVLAITCALAATLIACIVILINNRARDRWSRLAYFFASLPLGFPNVLLGLGFLFAFIQPPLVLYGTLTLLVLAYFVAFLPIAMNNVGPLVQQIGRELEEAALVSGTSWFGALRKVTFPLIVPGFASGAALLFVLIFRDYPLAAFLSTSGSQVVSMSLMGYNTSGQWNYVAVLAILLAFVSTLGIVAANIISTRFSIKSRSGPRPQLRSTLR